MLLAHVRLRLIVVRDQVRLGRQVQTAVSLGKPPSRKVGCFEPSEWSQARPSYPAKALAQAVPFQCKISELVVETAVSWYPTAQASLPERVLTP